MKTANQLGAGFCLTSLLLFATAQSFAAALPGLQLRITEPTPANEFTRHPELEWNGTSGAIYRVQSTTKLADPGSWAGWLGV